MAQYVISQTTICTGCPEKRARQVVSEMRKKGFGVAYGKATQLPENDAEFTEAFYQALDVVDYDRHTGGLR